MRSENDIFKSKYITFTFNGGTPINFDNHEIRGNVEYVPSSTPEIIKAESGKTFSINRPQQEYFRFVLSYEDIGTRKKVNDVFKAIQNQYILAFDFGFFISPFGQFPPVNSTTDLTSNTSSSVSFSSAVIEFPEDFSYDRIGRGEGSERIKEIEIRVYRAGVFTLPVHPCVALNAALTTDNFHIDPWFLEIGGDLIQVRVEKKDSIISTVNSWPTGQLYLNDALQDFMNPSITIPSKQAIYKPENIPLPTIVGVLWRIEINNISVTLVGGDVCTVSFNQEFGTPLGDFNSDFNNDFNIV